MKYLVDTNILSYLLDAKSIFYHNVVERIGCLVDSDIVAVSILSRYELERLFAVIPASKDAFQKHIRPKIIIQPLPEDGASVFQELMFKYDKNKSLQKPKYAVDAMLAASAITEGMILVSHDKIFLDWALLDNRLRVEDWAEP